MCYYRVYVFLGCGHTCSSAKPIRTCAAVRSKRQSISQQHTDTQQGLPPKVPPKAPPDDSRLTETLADAHITRVAADATFQQGHETATTIALNPHTGNANNSKDIFSSKSDSKLAPVECQEFSTHPFQTLAIHTSCARCLRRRDKLLEQLESETPTIRPEDWHWKVKYVSPRPEETRRSADWGNVGTVMGSWVKDWKAKGDGILGAFRDQRGDGDKRRDSVTGAMGLGIVGVLGESVGLGAGGKKGKGKQKGSGRRST